MKLISHTSNPIPSYKHQINVFVMLMKKGNEIKVFVEN